MTLPHYLHTDRKQISNFDNRIVPLDSSYYDMGRMTK
jgi:hypothetical protein